MENKNLISFDFEEIEKRFSLEPLTDTVDIYVFAYRNDKNEVISGKYAVIQKQLKGWEEATETLLKENNNKLEDKLARFLDEPYFYYDMVCEGVADTFTEGDRQYEFDDLNIDNNGAFVHITKYFECPYEDYFGEIDVDVTFEMEVVDISTLEKSEETFKALLNEIAEWDGDVMFDYVIPYFKKHGKEDCLREVLDASYFEE